MCVRGGACECVSVCARIACKHGRYERVEDVVEGVVPWDYRAHQADGEKFYA